MGKRNVVWLYNGYRADGSLIGDLEGCSTDHALEEFAAMYFDEGDKCVRVERIKGSGRPKLIITPDPETARFKVRYVQGGKRRSTIVRVYNGDHKGLTRAMEMFNQGENPNIPNTARRSTSAQLIPEK